MQINSLTIATETMKLEGQRFLLFRKLDKCTDLYEYGRIQGEILRLTTRIEQYQLVFKGLASIKRKMRK